MQNSYKELTRADFYDIVSSTREHIHKNVGAQLAAALMESPDECTTDYGRDLARLQEVMGILSAAQRSIHLLESLEREYADSKKNNVRLDSKKNNVRTVTDMSELSLGDDSW